MTATMQLDLFNTVTTPSDQSGSGGILSLTKEEWYEALRTMGFNGLLNLMEKAGVDKSSHVYTDNGESVTFTTGERGMAKKDKEKNPLTDAGHPALKYTLIVPKKEGTIHMLTGAKRRLTEEMLKKSSDGEVRIFMNWQEFYKVCDAAELKEYAMRFNVTITNSSKLNKMDYSILVWRKLCLIGHDITIANAVSSPTPGRGKKLSNRKYVIVKDSDLTDKELASRNTEGLPPQARVCLEILLSEGTDEVTEKRMKELMEEKKSLLATRQDAWRVFSYYRPQLISNRYVRLV